VRQKGGCRKFGSLEFEFRKKGGDSSVLAACEMKNCGRSRLKNEKLRNSDMARREMGSKLEGGGNEKNEQQEARQSQFLGQGGPRNDNKSA